MESGFHSAGSLFDQPLGHVCIGDLYLLVAGAGVGELFACVSIVQVFPDGYHLFGNVKASVLFSHDLEEELKPESNHAKILTYR